MSTTTITKTSFHRVTVPVMSVKRSDEETGEVTVDTIPGAVIAVPFATSKADAVDKALALHRGSYGIPANLHILPAVETVPLKVGTTVPSMSRSARFHGERRTG